MERHSISKETIDELRENQFKALQSLNLTRMTIKLKQLKEVLPQSWVNNLIIDRLIKTAEIQCSVKLGYLNYSTSRKNYNFDKYSLPV